MPVLRRLTSKLDGVNNNGDGTPSASNNASKAKFSNAGPGSSTSPAVMKAAKSHARKREDGHIPRPRNAFIIFRTEFVAKGLVPMCVETHSQNLSRIAGQVWKSMSPSERKVWFDRASEEKARHAEKYPGYQYHPTDPYALRNKRKVQKGRGTTELKAMDARCMEVAGLLVQGTEGDELKQAMDDLDKHKNAAVSDEFVGEMPNPNTQDLSAAATKMSSPSPLDSQPIEISALDSLLSYPSGSSREIMPPSPSTFSTLSSIPDSLSRVILPPLRSLPPPVRSSSSGITATALKHKLSLPFPGALIVPDKPRSSTSAASSPASSTHSIPCRSPSTAFQVPDYFASVLADRPREAPVRFGETWCPRS